LEKEMKLNLISALLCSALVSLAAPAQAITIGVADAPASFSFSDTGGGYNLALSGSLDLTGLTATTATLSITLNNISTFNNQPIANPGDVRLTAFGFGVNPNATAVSFSDSPGDGGMIAASLSSIPSLSSIEVCAYGGVNCPGGSNGGIDAQASDTFTLILTGNFGGLTQLAFDPLGVKFQTNVGSFEFSCTGTDCGGGGGGGNVPEPASLSLLGLGLIGMAAARRRRVA
jgi:hypothetical protein